MQQNGFNPAMLAAMMQMMQGANQNNVFTPQKVDIKQFGNWELSRLFIQIAKNPTTPGGNDYAKVCYFSVYDLDNPQGDEVQFTLFRDKLYNAAEPYATGDDIGHGKEVDLDAMQADPKAKRELDKYMHWPGFVYKKYPLSKGRCYANDINGQPRYLKKKPWETQASRVEVDSIYVPGRITQAWTKADGGFDITYDRDMDPIQNLHDLEATYFREAVPDVTVQTSGMGTEQLLNQVDTAEGAPEPNKADVPTGPDGKPLF